MAGDDGSFLRREFPFDDVQVCTANTAHLHTD
jgi:hypothetical protein